MVSLFALLFLTGYVSSRNFLKQVNTVHTKYVKMVIAELKIRDARMN